MMKLSKGKFQTILILADCAGCISGAGIRDPICKDRCVLAGAGVYTGSVRRTAICSEIVIYKG